MLVLFSSGIRQYNRFRTNPKRMKHQLAKVKTRQQFGNKLSPILYAWLYGSQSVPSYPLLNYYPNSPLDTLDSTGPSRYTLPHFQDTTKTTTTHTTTTQSLKSVSHHNLTQFWGRPSPKQQQQTLQLTFNNYSFPFLLPPPSSEESFTYVRYDDDDDDDSRKEIGTRHNSHTQTHGSRSSASIVCCCCSNKVCNFITKQEFDTRERWRAGKKFTL